MTFSEKLVAVRKNAGHTQAEMAKKTMISRPSLTHYENGEREPGIEFLRRLCEAYGVSPAWMLGLEEGDNDVMIFVSGRIETIKAEMLLQKAIGMCNDALNELKMIQGNPWMEDK